MWTYNELDSLNFSPRDVDMPLKSVDKRFDGS